MQKKILAAVLSLLLVGSASSAFAGYYDLDVKNSFKDQSDDDGYDIDVRNSLNGNDNDGLDLDITDSFKKDVDVDINKTTNVKINAQGNLVGGKFVVQQFGGKAGSGMGGDVVTVDNSINHSTINSFNDTNSHNRTHISNRNYTSTSNINSSYNTTRSSTRNTNVDVYVEVDASKTFKAKNSFNGNRLGGFPRVAR